MTPSADARSAGLHLFCSYAHEDRALLAEVRKHLVGLERSGAISGWDDRMITAGSDWEGTILDALEGADVILLLISADFLASDYCWDVEMRRALVRQAADEALVVPIILRPCDWAGAPFARLQCLPSEGRPIVSWSPRDAGWVDVVEGLRRAIEAELERTRRRSQAGPAPGADAAEARVLDAAIGSEVPVGRATDVVAMVRMPESGGLRAVLETDATYSAEPGDVRFSDFTMDFPVDAEGRPVKTRVVLRLEGSDFQPPAQEKTIELRPGEDSRTCVFLVTPLRDGPLLLDLELRHGDLSLVQQLLRTTGSEGIERRTLPSYVVQSMGFADAAAAGAATTLVPPAPPEPRAGAGGRAGPPQAPPAPSASVPERRAESSGCLPILLALVVLPMVAGSLFLFLR